MSDPKNQKTQMLDAPSVPAAPSSSQATVMMEAPRLSAGGSAPGAAPDPHGRQMVVPTLMQAVPQNLPPVAPPSGSGISRWVLGPIVAAVVAVVTLFVARAVFPHRVVRVVMGHVRVTSEPPGAAIWVDGKPFRRFTPNTIDAPVGNTIRLGLVMEGFAKSESNVLILEGEHGVAIKLEPVAPPGPPGEEKSAVPILNGPPPGEVAEPATPTPPVAAKDPTPAPDHHRKNGGHHEKVTGSVAMAKVSIFVRPWAIVSVDHVRLRQTPVQGYQLVAGRHVIELVNENKNKRERIEINLRPNEEQEIKRDWDQ